MTALFDLTEGATTASSGGSSFPVRFRSADRDAIGVLGRSPLAVAETSDAAGLAVGASITIDNQAFTLLRVEPAGVGISVLVLRGGV